MGIHPKGEQTIKSVKANGNALEVTCVSELTGKIWITTADVVIADTGTIPVDDLYRKLQQNSNNNGITDVSAFLSGKNQLDMDKPGISLFRIGDALSSRNVAAAMFDALRLCHGL